MDCSRFIMAEFKMQLSTNAIKDTLFLLSETQRNCLLYSGRVESEPNSCSRHVRYEFIFREVNPDPKRDLT